MRSSPFGQPGRTRCRLALPAVLRPVECGHGLGTGLQARNRGRKGSQRRCRSVTISPSVPRHFSSPHPYSAGPDELARVERHCGVIMRIAILTAAAAALLAWPASAQGSNVTLAESDNFRLLCPDASACGEDAAPWASALAPRLLARMEDLRVWLEDLGFPVVDSILETGDGGKGWYSESIYHNPERISYEEAFKFKFLEDEGMYQNGSSVLIYKFNDGENQYQLCLYPPIKKINQYLPLIICRYAENKVLEVVFFANIYYSDSYETLGDYIEFELIEFRNRDEWLEILLDIMYKVRQEEKEISTIWHNCEPIISKGKDSKWHELNWAEYKRNKELKLIQVDYNEQKA